MAYNFFSQDVKLFCGAKDNKKVLATAQSAGLFRKPQFAVWLTVTDWDYTKVNRSTAIVYSIKIKVCPLYYFYYSKIILYSLPAK